MSSQPLYYARRGGWQYGPNHPDDIVDLDQVLTLRRELNDERLIRLGFLAQVTSNPSLVGCGLCGKKFITDSALALHGKKWHAGKRDINISDAKKVPKEQIAYELENRLMGDATGVDAQEEVVSAEERAILASRPIHFDKTEGARKAGDAPVPEVTTAPKNRRGRPRKVSSE